MCLDYKVAFINTLLKPGIIFAKGIQPKHNNKFEKIEITNVLICRSHSDYVLFITMLKLFFTDVMISYLTKEETNIILVIPYLYPHVIMARVW